MKLRVIFRYSIAPQGLLSKSDWKKYQKEDGSFEFMYQAMGK